MWSLFKKEFMEARVQLATALLVILGILDFAAASKDWNFLIVGDMWSRRAQYQNLSGSPLPMATWVMLCAGVAAGLAARLVYGEQWRRTWPLLALLPADRSRLIFAKLLAGLAIYALVLLPPMVLMMWRLSVPGVWPWPFDLQLVMPLFYVFLAAGNFYLVVFLAALRPARWYGTKWLLLLTSLPAAGLAIYAVESARWAESNFTSDVAQERMRVFLIFGAALLFCTIMVLWAIRLHARTREY